MRNWPARILIPLAICFTTIFEKLFPFHPSTYYFSFSFFFFSLKKILTFIAGSIHLHSRMLINIKKKKGGQKGETGRRKIELFFIIYKNFPQKTLKSYLIRFSEENDSDNLLISKIYKTFSF